MTTDTDRQPKPCYGYFSGAGETNPTYDPGLHVECPICHNLLSNPLITISLMNFANEEDPRSYFYRTHKNCYDSLTEREKSEMDSIILDTNDAIHNIN